MKIVVFCDVSNLYYCCSQKFTKVDGPRRKLDYGKYLSYIKDLGTVRRAIAYGAQKDDDARGFITSLQDKGFETKFKKVKKYKNDGITTMKADWDCGIAVDIMRCAESYDAIVLGSADGDMVPVVEWCKEKGIKVFVIACGISRDLKNVATEYIEILEELLEDINASTKNED